jgi:hypothetical protein
MTRSRRPGRQRSASPPGDAFRAAAVSRGRPRGIGRPGRARRGAQHPVAADVDEPGPQHQPPLRLCGRGPGRRAAAPAGAGVSRGTRQFRAALLCAVCIVRPGGSRGGGQADGPAERRLGASTPAPTGTAAGPNSPPATPPLPSTSSSNTTRAPRICWRVTSTKRTASGTLSRPSRRSRGRRLDITPGSGVIRHPPDGPPRRTCFAAGCGAGPGPPGHDDVPGGTRRRPPGGRGPAAARRSRRKAEGGRAARRRAVRAGGEQPDRLPMSHHPAGRTGARNSRCRATRACPAWRGRPGNLVRPADLARRGSGGEVQLLRCRAGHARGAAGIARLPGLPSVPGPFPANG